jgi:hypothetical protein
MVIGTVIEVLMLEQRSRVEKVGPSRNRRASYRSDRAAQHSSAAVPANGRNTAVVCGSKALPFPGNPKQNQRTSCLGKPRFADLALASIVSSARTPLGRFFALILLPLFRASSFLMPLRAFGRTRRLTMKKVLLIVIKTESCPIWRVSDVVSTTPRAQPPGARRRREVCINEEVNEA